VFAGRRHRIAPCTLTRNCHEIVVNFCLMSSFYTQVLQQLVSIHANQTQIIIPNQEKIMSTLSDLQAADTAIKASVASAITLIKSLHAAVPAGTVADADVEAVVADLTAAAAALGGATPQP
jgi:hypothetical protein